MFTCNNRGRLSKDRNPELRAIVSTSLNCLTFNLTNVPARNTRPVRIEAIYVYKVKFGDTFLYPDLTKVRACSSLSLSSRKLGTDKPIPRIIISQSFNEIRF